MGRIYLLLAITVMAIACNDDEVDDRPVYTLQSLELVDQQLFVVAADQTADSTAMTSRQDSTAYEARILRLPDYLATHTIRSFKQLDAVNWLITIQVPDGSFPFTDSILLDSDRFVQLPSYRYDSSSDIVYQCDRTVKTTKGPQNPGFSVTSSLPCDNRPYDVIADSVAIIADPGDTLLISELRLPYRQL
jgi:hypothetical protein